MSRTLSILFLCSALARAQAGPVADGLKWFCDIRKDYAGKDMSEMSKEESKELGEKVAKVVTEKMDCSMDPYDKVAGYNLHDVAFEKCMEADFKAMYALTGATEKVKLQTDSFECIELIADEDADVGAAWAHMKWTVGDQQFENRVAFRFHFDKDGKFDSYHYIVDLLPAFKEFSKSRLFSMQAPIFGRSSGPNMAVVGGVGAVIGASIVMVVQGFRRRARAITPYNELEHTELE